MRAVLAIVIAVSAQSALAENLVSNPDFSHLLTNWGLGAESPSGSILGDFSHGAPAPPSARVYGNDETVNGSLRSTCIAIDDRAEVDFSFQVLVVAGTADGVVQTYSDALCSMPIGSIPTPLEPVNPQGIWTQSVQTFALTSGTHSVDILLNAWGNDAQTRGDAYFDHVAFGPTGTLPATININQEGLAGAWYDPAQSGQGFQFAINAAMSAYPGSQFYQGSLFGAWYTYDTVPGGADTQRWYSIESVLTGDAGSAEVTIYQNTGGNFGAPPKTTAVPVGTGTLAFDSCTSGAFAYSFDDGRTGSIPLRTILPTGDCDETGGPIFKVSIAGLSGAWYAPALGGQGVMINVDTSGEVFVGWYTYAPHGSAASAEGQRWFSAQGETESGSGESPMSLVVFESTGGAFNTDGRVTTTPVGTATLTFASCQQATLDYAFTDGDLAGSSGTLNLTRLGVAPRGCSLTNP